MSRGRVAIIGAGPIGLETAAYARIEGYDVTVLEQGDAIAAHVREWGGVRLFSPFGMNASPWGRRLLEQAGQGRRLPPADALLTGDEFIEAYLEPLAQHPVLGDVIHLRSRVVGVGRPGVLKTELSARARRSQPFRILVETRDENQRGSVREWDLWADIVVDCSGTYGQTNWVGAGGMPCPGERELVSPADHRIYDPDEDPRSVQRAGEADRSVADPDGARCLDAWIVIVGAGYSAATSVLNVAAAAESENAVLWITRRGDRGTPIPVIADDPLPERRRITERANALATGGRPCVRWLPGFEVVRIAQGRTRRLRLTVRRTSFASAGSAGRGELSASDESGRTDLRSCGGVFAADFQNNDVAIECDRLVANVGYRPDWEPLRELQVHQCYATEGPIKLAAALLGETGADCLATTSLDDPSLLRNPEPGLFVLGAKSFGRNSNFLLATGHRQIRQVFDNLV
ncbi:MAG: hypothetical protein D6725_01400 [Planctomycetota bacterium]|nr:MAG: hypothetical protein D6725_01400 [Planctomycetota bacterium]